MTMSRWGIRAVDHRAGSLRAWLRPSGAWPLGALLALPIGLLGLQPAWLYGDRGRDPWIYFGYFQYAPRYASEFAHAYYSSRLSLILPGYWLSGFAPDRAHLILHMALAWLAIGSLFLLARSLFGIRTAVASTLVLASHPYALRALGHSYPDGFAIAYLPAAMLAVRLSTLRRLPFLCLGVAGAFSWALVTLNLYYALFLPGLAAQLVVDARALGPNALKKATFSAVLGAVLCFLAFGTVNASWGGPFFYLAPSMSWVARRVSGEQPNIWTDASRAWLANGTWLALPVLTSIAVVVGRPVARATSDGARTHVAIFQGSFVLVTGVFTALQISGWSSPLEHKHYASVLIPMAILSLAGWIAPGLRQLERATWVAVLCVLGAMLTAPYLVNPDGQEPGGSDSLTPLQWGLLAGGPIVIGTLLSETRRGSLSILLGAGLLQISILNTSQPFASFREVDRRQQPAAYRQLANLIDALGPRVNDSGARLWYDRGERIGWFYDAAASAFLLCPRMFNLVFPDSAGGKMCNGRPFVPGTRIALLSSAPDAEQRAAESLAPLGIGVRTIEHGRIDGPVPDVAFFVLDTVALPEKGS